MSNSPEKTVRVSLYHLLDLFVSLKCPQCGHEQMVTENEMRVVKGVSYVKKDDPVVKQKVPAFKVVVGEEVEL